MEAEGLIFTAKDVIGIIMLAVSVLGAYFALKKDIEKATAKTTEIEGSHVLMISHPKEVLKVIEEAVTNSK